MPRLRTFSTSCRKLGIDCPAGQARLLAQLVTEKPIGTNLLCGFCGQPIGWRWIDADGERLTIACPFCELIVSGYFFVLTRYVAASKSVENWLKRTVKGDQP